MEDASLISENAARSKLGSLGTLEDGRKYVVFKRYLPHSIDKVWGAITEPDHLADWFPGIKLERRVGGRFEIWFSENCEGPAHVTGAVTRYEPPNVLELGTMRYELTSEGDGCSLTFSDILHYEGPLSEADVINSVLGGWHKYLDSLEFYLIGGKSDPRDEPEFDYSKVQIDGRD